MQLTDFMLNLRQELAKSERPSKSRFLKVKGKTTIRIAVDSENPGYTCIFTRKHKVWGAKPWDSVDLDWLVLPENEEVRELALEKGKITGRDLTLIKEFGDPFNLVRRRAWDMLSKEDRGNQFDGLRANNTYIWQVINRADGTVCIYETGATLATTIQELIGTVDNPGEYPDLLDIENGYDIVIGTNGKTGNEVRYTFTPARKPSPQGDVKLSDLRLTVVNKVVDFQSKAAKLLEVFGPQCELVGVDAELFKLVE